MSKFALWLGNEHGYGGIPGALGVPAEALTLQEAAKRMGVRIIAQRTDKTFYVEPLPDNEVLLAQLACSDPTARLIMASR